MNHYAVRSITSAHVDLLQSSLEQRKIPHTVAVSGKERIVHIGQDSDYELSAAPQRGGRTKVSIGIRYEHPGLKAILCDWLDKCGGKPEDDFYTWHSTLSPSVINAIGDRWCVQLGGLPVTPVKFGRVVMVLMCGRNVESELSGQLAAKPHRRLEAGEFIKSAEFEVTGEDPFDTVAYAWRTSAGSQLYVVTASAPAMTMLSLWVISEGVPVETRLGAFNEGA